MPDLFHVFGSDLVVAASGDLATASEPDFTRQRILRRFLTNPGDYIWHPDYGAGLPQFVGQPEQPLRIAAIVRRQIALEAGVATSPTPTVAVTYLPTGAVFVAITYSESATGLPQTLNHTVT